MAEQKCTLVGISCTTTYSLSAMRHTRTHTHARTHARTHTCTHARMHAHTHAHTHTHSCGCITLYMDESTHCLYGLVTHGNWAQSQQRLEVRPMIKATYWSVLDIHCTKGCPLIHGTPSGHQSEMLLKLVLLAELVWLTPSNQSSIPSHCWRGNNTSEAMMCDVDSTDTGYHGCTVTHKWGV